MSTDTLVAAVSGAVLALAAGAVAVGCGAEEAEPDAHRAPLVVERLSDELELDAAQRVRLEDAHAILAEHRESHLAEREAHFAEIRDAVGSGEVDEAEVHARIDAKAEEMRQLAHRVADELIPLLQSLDESQREEAVELMDRFHDRMRAFHERMEAEGAAMGPFERLRAHHGIFGRE